MSHKAVKKEEKTEILSDFNIFHREIKIYLTKIFTLFALKIENIKIQFFPDKRFFSRIFVLLLPRIFNAFIKYIVTIILTEYVLLP